MRLVGLIPALHGVEGCHPAHKDAKQRLLQMGEALASVGITQVRFRHVEHCSMLPLARDLLVSLALAEEADYTLWVDDDIWFRVEDIVAGIASTLPIVAYPCFHKPEPDGTMHFRLNYDIFEGEPIIDADKEWRQVRMCGTGLMLVKTEVYRAMQKRTVQFTSPDFEARMLNQYGLTVGPHLFDYFVSGPRDMRGKVYFCGEDVGFCAEASAAGYPVFMYCSGITAHMRGQFGATCDYRAIREQVRQGTAQVSLPYA
jgi:hypothetical protein